MPSLGKDWEYDYAMVTFVDGGQAAAAVVALNGTSIKHERITEFTSDKLEFTIYTEPTRSGDDPEGDDTDDWHDDDDDDFCSTPADSVYDLQ